MEGRLANQMHDPLVGAVDLALADIMPHGMEYI